MRPRQNELLRVQEPDVIANEFPSMLVPPDPESRAHPLKVIRNLQSHNCQFPVFKYITNDKDDKVIAAMRARLNDHRVNEAC